MSQAGSSGRVTSDQTPNFTVTMMHHPCHHVPDLQEAEAWFKRVFGRESTGQDANLSKLPMVQGWWPRDYCLWTPIRDVLFDSIDPKLFVTDNDGLQRWPTVEKPHLEDLGWSVDGMTGAFRRIKEYGLHATRSTLELVEGDDPPTGPNDPAPFFLLPEEVGRRYRFYPADPFPADPRCQPGWTLGSVSDGDPLGIQCSSHHTVLTDRPERALRLYVDVLNGTIVHEGRDDLRGLNSTFVYFAGSMLEFAVPDLDTAAHADWLLNQPLDTYHAITWKVADLARTVEHLESQGTKIAMRSADTIVTDPDTSLGIPWGFTTKFVQGDPRADG